MKQYLKSIRTALLFSIGMMLLCGVFYPFAVTAASQLIFHDKANGSLIEVDGKVVGSELVGQEFSDERYFTCRPSAYNYNTYTEEDKNSGVYAGIGSGSHNYSASNPALKKRMESDIKAFLKNNPGVNRSDIPEDIVTASGSGLDPHISEKAAHVQVDAIAEASGLSKDKLQTIIKDNTTQKVAGVLGEVTVNVLGCNLDIAKELNVL